MPHANPRRICFVTGTRAEFGLMRHTLHAIRSHPALKLQLIATGMHLDPAHGHTLQSITTAGFRPNAIIPWPANTGQSPTTNAVNTAHAIAHLALAYKKLRPDIVLVVGDRTEAFAAAAAAHLSHIPLAHVHGGDRATGQIDDSLRHAITKLAHIHFPATPQSARRLLRLGEDPWRIHRVGSPGLYDIHTTATPWPQILSTFPTLQPRRYALLLLHPADPDPALEYRRADTILRAVQQTRFDHTIIIYPNNDPGASGILRRWNQECRDGKAIVGSPTSSSPHPLTLLPDLPRPLFLGLLAHAAVLIGNSSSGIIEAASFHTPVLDIGPRQTGRQHASNVAHSDYSPSSLRRHLKRLWNSAHPRPSRSPNPYAPPPNSPNIPDILATITLSPNLLRKLIRY